MKRDKKGRYLRSKPSVWRRKQIKTDHLYCVNQENETTDSDECEPWKTGRRLVEWEVLLSNLRYCQKCRLGPVPLTYYSVKGELQKGLGGYLYVQCGNHDCGYINRAAYGKTYCEPSKQGRQGMPCFAVNTKLGTAMIDSLGGPKRVNNMLATLNMKPISDANLKLMEKRAGDVVEKVSEESTRTAADEAFRNEMEKIATQESLAAQANMSGLIEDLGVCPLPDASPAVNLRLEDIPEDDWTDDDDDNGTDNHVTETECVPEVSGSMSIDNSSTPTDVRYPLPPPHCTPSTDRTSNRPGRKSKVRLLTKYPCSTRSGMSVAVDTAWHKKGFDSLTSHTFFMTTDKSSQRKKVVKTIVGHRTCGVCSWWRRKRPGQKVRPHRCVRNHTGSARAMEATSGVKGVRELFEEGTPIEYLEGDGDSTLISKIKTELNVTMKKRFDKNHVVKNFTKKLYKLRSEKGIKLSKNIISHLEKCLKYTFAKNQGDQDGMEENLKAIVPHQFGDHSLCCARFCGYKRRPGEKYIHRSLPYKTPLHDENLRQRLQEMFNPLIFNAHQYIDLGSSQQCEHANKEVTLRAPKSHHYGNSSSLDYRVHATAAFVNEGRHYISKGYSKIGLSPGKHSVKYAGKCLKRRHARQLKAQSPSTKRRRLELKKERAINQGANEALEGNIYQSGIGHEESVDTEQIPGAIPKANFKPVNFPGEPTVITFDLETTGLIEGRLLPQITQIAAVEVKSGDQFNIYVTPTVQISKEATDVTGITKIGDEMKVNGIVVESVSIRLAVSKMISWLSKFSRVCLVAHNGRRFDFQILVSTLKNIGDLDKLSECAFIDSLSVFRKLYPGQSLKQVALVSSLLGETYDAHNAMADVIALGKLLQFVNLPSKNLMEHSFTPFAVANNLVFNNTKALNLPTLHPLIYTGVLKKPTAENIAGSGLNLMHLRMLHTRGGEDAIRDVFTAKNSDGLPRVSNAKKVLEEIVPKISQYFDKNSN